MKTCLNCGQENRTNRLVCAECTARGTKSAPRVLSLGEANRANGIGRWLRRVMNFIQIRPAKNAAPTAPCRQASAMPDPADEMDQLSAWFKQHHPKPDVFELAF